MDILSKKLFSLTQFSESENSVVFKGNTMDVLFNHIQSEPKHGQRIVALNLDNTLMLQKNMTEKGLIAFCPETVEAIKRLQAARCLVVGFATIDINLADTLIKALSEKNLSFNQGFFKNTHSCYQSSIKEGRFKEGIMFVNKSQMYKALRTLIRAFEIDPDNVYFMEKALPHLKQIKNHSNTDDTDELGTSFSHMSLAHLPHPFGLFFKNLKIEFKQKNSTYKPFSYFWLNHQKDLYTIQAFYNAEQCKPKITIRFYSFKPNQHVIACRIKVPLEKMVPLVGFLYHHQIIKQKDLVQTKNILPLLEEKIKSSRLSL